jgi:hypothetical protein
LLLDMNRGFLIHLMCLAATLSWAAEEKTPFAEQNVPPQEKILTTVRPGHPRLLATSEDFLRLRERVAADPQLRAWQEKIAAQAGRILAAPPSKYEIPDGLRLLATSRRVLDRVYTLALQYRLTGDKAWAERAWTELDTAASFPDWNPKHFLDTAEMTHAFAIGYDWLFDFLTTERRQRLQQAIVEKGFGPGLKVYRAKSGWSRAVHNWNQVCNGGLGIGALALAEVEPEAAAEVLKNAVESLPRAMVEFGPDGAWKEGPGYWNYATSYNVAFLAALESALGTDFGLSQITGFRDTGLFPIYLTGPLGRTFNYADGGDHAIHAPQMFWLAKKFNQPVFAWYEHQLATPSPLDLIWASPADRSPSELRFPLDKYFRVTEVASFRSGWGDSEAVFAAVKAGDNKANHSHLDLGSFVMDALGVRWVMELGADDYNLPGYFGARRWDYYRLRTEGQNTLVINPGAGPGQDPKAAAKITRFESKQENAFAITDLTSAYRQEAQSVSRGLALLHRKEVLIQDEIHLKEPGEILWAIHTPTAARVDDEGKTILLEQAGKRLQVRLLSPPSARLEVRDATPLPSSPKVEKQAKNDGIRKVVVHQTGVRDCRITVLLRPLSHPEDASATSPEPQPLSAW